MIIVACYERNSVLLLYVLTCPLEANAKRHTHTEGKIRLRTAFKFILVRQTAKY